MTRPELSPGAREAETLIAEYRRLGGDVQFLRGVNSAGVYTRYPRETSERSRAIEARLVALAEDVAIIARQEAGE